MHYGLPPRKTSHPPPYVASRPQSPSYLRRVRLRTLAWVFGTLLFLIILLSQLNKGRKHRFQPEVIPPGTPPVVLVTTLDPSSSVEYRRMITENRKQYAALHGKEGPLSITFSALTKTSAGYATFLPQVTDYPLRIPKIIHSDPKSPAHQAPIPSSWSKIPAVRHAMTKFPHSTYFFFLDRSAMITDPSLSVEEHITDKARLESLMIPDQPIVPPGSVIRTLHTRKADQVDFIVTQDQNGLSQSSFIVRRGEWAKYFLDAWYDPLYRSYNFQRAEGHALEHLVQWHGTILSRMALVPQSTMNSNAKDSAQALLQNPPFVVSQRGCDTTGQASCEDAVRPWFERFKMLLPPKSM